MRKKKDYKIIANTEIGARIRFIRKQKGLTQMQLAERVGVSFQQIQKYEKGKDRIFVERLQQIARALDVPIYYFFQNFEAEGQVKEEGHPFELISNEIKEILPLTPEEIYMIKKLRTMGKKIRSSFLNQLKAISETLSPIQAYKRSKK
ncbi:MAG: helix-turn-helix transcriptional regulator [Candidatus Desulfofervidaceae bacterium]|nr:helix-turn-helix transcriptional regulator [Candidatus Desulfofervidaceae bacterium]